MKLKRLLVLAGVVALVGMLWASPVAADGHLPSITIDPASVPAEAGEVTVEVTGANWEEPAPFFITACPGAAGDPTAIVDVVAALSMCPTITSDVRTVTWDDGGFTTEITVTVGDDDIAAGGLVILAGWLSASASSNPEDGDATFTVLVIADPEPVMEEEPAAEEPMDEPAAEEPMDEPAAEEPMDEPAAEELPDTGSESNMLAIVGAGILVAGLLAIGTGRRVRTVTR